MIPLKGDPSLTGEGIDTLRTVAVQELQNVKNMHLRQILLNLSRDHARKQMFWQSEQSAQLLNPHILKIPKHHWNTYIY